MSKLIIVCGFPASGKTSLSKELSRRMNMFCLHKDSIKENLFETMGLSTLEDSKRIGAVSSKLLLALAREQLANGVDLIIEAPFNFPKDYDLFAQWEKEYGVKMYKVICRIGDEERVNRYNDRLAERHYCHCDNQRVANGEVEVQMDYSIYDSMPGEKMEIETNRPVEVLAEEIINKIN